MIFFSIIIPTYNRVDFIGKTIQSVLEQTYTDFEVIVVDDGSTDNTEKVVKSIRDSRISYYQKVNGERAAARNFGTLRAKGNYITFLDSDDLLYPHYFQNAAEAITRYNQPPFLHLGYEVTDTSLSPKTKINWIQSDDLNIFVKGNPLSCMGVFMRKDVAVQFLFNEDRNLSGSEDWELWIRVVANCGIKTDNRISAALVDHESRSVVQYSEEKLSMRKELALKYAFQDKAVEEKFRSYYKQIESYWDSYIALHLVLAGKNEQGIRYLIKALKEYPSSVLERRTLAILKHTFFNKLKKHNPLRPVPVSNSSVRNRT